MMWRRLGLSFRNALEFPAPQQHIGLSIYLYSRLLLSIKFLLGFNFLTGRMEVGTLEVAHSGSKWPQTAKNKFARCDFTSFPNKFKEIRMTSVSVWASYSKICQTVASMSITCQFYDIFSIVFGGFLLLSPTGRASDISLPPLLWQRVHKFTQQKGCRNPGTRGCSPPLYFDRSVNPNSTGGRLCPPHYSLISIRQNYNFDMLAMIWQ